MAFAAQIIGRLGPDSVYTDSDIPPDYIPLPISGNDIISIFVKAFNN